MYHDEYNNIIHKIVTLKYRLCEWGLLNLAPVIDDGIEKRPTSHIMIIHIILLVLAENFASIPLLVYAG